MIFPKKYFVAILFYETSVADIPPPPCALLSFVCCWVPILIGIFCLFSFDKNLFVSLNIDSVCFQESRSSPLCWRYLKIFKYVIPFIFCDCVLLCTLFFPLFSLAMPITSEKIPTYKILDFSLQNHFPRILLYWFGQNQSYIECLSILLTLTMYQCSVSIYIFCQEKCADLLVFFFLSRYLHTMDVTWILISGSCHNWN